MTRYAGIRERAAQLLERDGWCQSARQGQRRCLVVAIFEAQESFDAEARAAEEIEETIEIELGLKPKFSLADWNDAPTRTLPQVLAALRGQPIPQPEEQR